MAMLIRARSAASRGDCQEVRGRAKCSCPHGVACAAASAGEGDWKSIAKRARLAGRKDPADSRIAAGLRNTYSGLPSPATVAVVNRGQ